MSNTIANTVTTNILPVQALYDPTTLAFITFIGPAGTPFTGSGSGVSSVNVSGGTTGLTTSGGPIVSSGTITIAGTLNVGNGGTGSTTANGALTNLLPTQTGNSGKFLTTDGTNTSWSTVGSGLTISTDNTTNASRYLTFTATTNGVITSENVSTALYFNPSSGSLTATTFVGALTGNASTATSATTSTNLAGGAGGSLPYQTGSGATTFLAAGSNGQYLVLSGGVPTWANLTTVTSFSAGTTGLTPSTSTSGAVTLAGTLNVANGGTGVTTSSGASSVVLRDANANTSANDFYEGFTNVAAAGTTITLTAASTPNFVITGSGGQTYKLPDATTIPTGAIYTFNNNQTSGAISVQNNSGTLVVSVPSGGFVEIILLTNSVAAGTWDYHFQAPSNVSWSTNTFSYAGSITNATWNGVSIGAIYGGTGQTSYTTGDTLYASASNTLSKLAIGSTGQVLTVAGGVPTWSSPASGASITDDTTTNGTRYINFTSATSGSLSTIYTSSTKLQYNPSTGTITTTAFSGSGASLTSLNASNISSGTIGSSYVSGSYTSITGLGTVTTGVWNANVIAPTYGGTGVNNGTNTLTLAGNVTHAGAFAQTFTASATTSLNLPTSGYLISTVTNLANNPVTGTPSSTTYLRGDGTWASVSASAGGSNTQVQYNSSGAFAGSANFTFNGTTVTMANDASIHGLTVGLGGGSVSTNTALGSQAIGGANTATYQTAVGYQSLNANTSGNQNTGTGGLSLQANTTGSNNSAFGMQALQTNTTGSNNSASGSTALILNTTGSNNTAQGNGALYNNTTASNNTAVGYQACYSNTTAGNNLAIGFQSLYTNSTGSNLIGIGYQAGYSNTGNDILAIGYQSLYSNTTGGNNIGIGTWALKLNTTGGFNTALGYYALQNNTSNYNTAVGYQALTGVTTGQNNVGVGYYSGNDSLVSITTQSNYVVLGNNSTTTLYCKTSTISTSDIREKTNIRPVTLGLDFVNKVNTIAYQFRVSRNSEEATGPVYLGWSAQDVLANQENEKLVDDSDPEYLKLATTNLVAVLWNAVQELSKEVETLKSKLGT